MFDNPVDTTAPTAKPTTTAQDFLDNLPPMDEFRLREQPMAGALLHTLARSLADTAPTRRLLIRAIAQERPAIVFVGELSTGRNRPRCAGGAGVMTTPPGRLRSILASGVQLPPYVREIYDGEPLAATPGRREA